MEEDVDTNFNRWNTEYIDLYQEEWWRQLDCHSKTAYNEWVIDKVVPFIILSPTIVEVIFSICKKLDQPPETRYLTIEIFDRFMARHHKQLHECIWDRSPDNHLLRQWERVTERIQRQMILRAMSCMQLASKFVNYKKCLHSSVIMNYLKSVGQSFTLHNIMASEKRVYETLNFKLPLYHPLMYVDYLTERLSKLEVISDIKLLHSTSISVLDVVYIQHKEIYSRLFHMISGRWERTEAERESFLAVECDKLFLACAVVACAAEISEPNNGAIIQRLSQETGCLLQDIEGLSSIISEIILPDKNAAYVKP
ncbi:cyclin N-terminal domain-containing protein 1-like [Periplaneta americana]|uniref:cyclin N-terminal domain-containing protein 1-like n=1 Tax=Periplaneta americana TaxID=6978 RepID=UPI0037E96C36